MFEDVIWEHNPTLWTPLTSWVLTIIHGALTWIIVQYTISKVSFRKTVLDTSNIALVSVMFILSLIATTMTTVLSVTINAGWAVSKFLGFAGFWVGFLYHSELIANAWIQACLIAYPCTLYSPVFNSIARLFVKLGLPTTSILSYGLLQAFSGTNFY